MKTSILIAGVLLLVAGIAQLWITLRLYRGGKAWGGSALSAAAITAYGGLTLAGLIFNDTVAGAVLMWAIATALWAGLWLSHRERVRAGR